MIILQNLLETRHNYFITIIIADYSRNIYYFVLKTNITYYFQPIIIMSLPQPHNHNFIVARKSQHYYLVPIQ